MEVYRMQKKLIAAVLFAAVATGLFAYNPPAGGQNLFRITEPQLLTGAGSSAGGAIFGVTPASIVNNPALTAYEQRIVLDVAGTMLFNSKDSDHSVGSAFEGGLLIPTRWGVWSSVIQGIFVPFYDMQLGNNIALSTSFSKDITDMLSVGVGVNFGVFYGYKSDWTGSANLGALYRIGTVSFLKDVRFGASLMNLGKMYTNTTVYGIYDGDDADMWPGIATPRFGAAATILSAGRMDLGLSTDISIPAFQNFVFDAGLKMEFAKIVTLSTSWEYDAREFAQGAKNIMPSVGLSIKFLFNSKDGSMMAEHGWQQSEMTVSGGWQQLYKNVNAVSTGAVLDLGLKDTKAPEITLWGEE
jgi:hypothetical protein